MSWTRRALCFFLLAGLAWPADLPDPLAGFDLAARMRELKVPGVSVAVIDNGAIVWARGYGVKTGGSPEPVTAETLFQAASISKPVAAMAALHMAQHGNFGLDEEVNRHLKTWKVPENEFTRDKKVTLRGLLSHSAGLTVHGFPGYAAGAGLPSVVQILDGLPPANTKPVRVDIAPGAEWRYSGGGYTVMQQLLVDRFGAPFPELMRRIVLARLGMSHSTYQQPLPVGRTGAAAAAAHQADGNPLPGQWHTYPEMAAAGLWTTPSDLARFAIELQKSWAGQSERVISRSMAREMVTRQKENYGLGVALAGQGRSARFSHGGSNAGFRCFLVAYLEAAHGAVVMTNSDNGSRLASEVVGVIARSRHWPD